MVRGAAHYPPIHRTSFDVQVRSLLLWRPLLGEDNTSEQAPKPHNQRRRSGIDPSGSLVNVPE